MNRAHFDMADSIAQSLARANTDHNELAKSSTYLNQTRDAKAFFTWLDWMATPRVSEKLARSKRTPDYYRQIRDACQQLRTIEDVDEMAQTLGWAVRLMRYIPHARPVDPEMLAATLEVRPVAGAEKRPACAPLTGRPIPITDMRPGMELIGTVKRTANFGAFVDVGVGRDGLVHVSKLREGYVSSVEEVVRTGQQVTVWVESVDVGRGRISLTMIRPKTVTPPPKPAPKPIPAPKPSRPEPPSRPAAVQVSSLDEVKPGMWVKATIQAIEHNRLVVDIGLADTATLMFEHLPGQPVDPLDVEDRYQVGQEIEAQVRRINKRGRVQLTLLS